MWNQTNWYVDTTFSTNTTLFLATSSAETAIAELDSRSGGRLATYLLVIRGANAGMMSRRVI